MNKELLFSNCRLISAGVRAVYIIQEQGAQYDQFIQTFTSLLNEHINKFSGERLKGLHSYQDVLYKAFIACIPRVASDFLKLQLLIAAFTELFNEAEKLDIYRRSEANALNPEPILSGWPKPNEL